MKINLEVVENLAKNISKYNLSELTFEGEGEKITIKREIPSATVVTQVVQQPQVVAMPVSQVVENSPLAVDSKEEITSYETINSPMVGTYYKSPAPGAAPFVTEGQEVKEGDVICIVEAMKLMNEVRATKNCKIIKVLAKEGTVLKKGDPIFAIE